MRRALERAAVGHGRQFRVDVDVAPGLSPVVLVPGVASRRIVVTSYQLITTGAGFATMYWALEDTAGGIYLPYRQLRGLPSCGEWTPDGHFRIALGEGLSLRPPTSVSSVVGYITYILTE